MQAVDHAFVVMGYRHTKRFKGLFSVMGPDLRRGERSFCHYRVGCNPSLDMVVFLKQLEMDCRLHGNDGFDEGGNDSVMAMTVLMRVVLTRVQYR